jgi:hypothetical protein
LIGSAKIGRCLAMPYVQRPLARPGAVVAIAAALTLACSPTRSADEGPMAHVRALYEIAVANGGNRAAGSPGYDKSATYVAERLTAAGYEVRLEEFSFPFFEERSPPVLALVPPEAGPVIPQSNVRTLRRSGTGDVAASLSPVDLGPVEGTEPGPSTSGCEADDFRGFHGAAWRSCAAAPAPSK